MDGTFIHPKRLFAASRFGHFAVVVAAGTHEALAEPF